MTLMYLTGDNNTYVDNCQYIAVSQRVRAPIRDENAVTAYWGIVDVGCQSSWCESDNFNTLIHLFCWLIHHADSNIATAKIPVML